MKLHHRAGTAALLLAVVVTACSAQAAPTPIPTSPPTPTAAPSDDPAATPTPAPTAAPQVSWRRNVVPDAPDVSSITAMSLTPDGQLVAHGFNGAFGSLLWTTDDGHTWTDRTPADFASAGLAGVTRFGDRLVAVGRGDTINVDANVAAVYLSDDGLTWRQAATDLEGQLIDVIATDDGLYAVGGVPAADAAGIWHSADGAAWERIGPDFEQAFLWSIAEGGPGLVAVGWRRNPEPDLAVWTSTDGQVWELAPDPEGFAGREATSVVALPDGTLVMAGSGFDGSGGHVWTSTDGRTWDLGDFDPADGSVRSLVVSPWGVIGLGGGHDMSGRAWISADGRTWVPLGDPVPEAYFNDAFVTDEGLVFALGGTQSGTLETGITGRAMIWSASLD